MDHLTIEQRAALNKLVGYNEGIVNGGALAGASNDSLRHLITETCTAFGMTPTTAKPPAATVAA